VADPLGGSYYIEWLTNQIVQEAEKIINEIEELGGMAKAIASGMPKMRIEESAARRQARIDQGKDVIVGVNKYRLKDEKLDFDILEVPDSVRLEQIERINQIKKTRDNAKCQACLDAITKAAAGKENLLGAAIEAAKARATVGEISDAMEKVFGRYVATTQCVSGAYSSEYSEVNSDSAQVIEALRKRTGDFLAKTGRRPRILVTKMGQDGHDRGIKVVASSYADLGFDVDISPMFQTPDEAAKMAIENDVHVVGASSLAAGHKTLVPELIQKLKEQGAGEILVVAGGVIPPSDYQYLYDAGCKGIYGPGTPITESAGKVMDMIEAQYCK
jgi:methylmalonyl-CoA mutase